jgi:hypothetical protein
MDKNPRKYNTSIEVVANPGSFLEKELGRLFYLGPCQGIGTDGTGT